MLVVRGRLARCKYGNDDGTAEVTWATRSNKPDAARIEEKAACYSKLFGAIGWRQDVRD
ncbi:hypothetical protein [Pseudovibrio axinellae]|uniref:hypothetical protein n=1 Tax=Pseudovibrio axinellae TaxID=989403 RepID=UPI000A7D62D9|nr:hypothetical protein [Pseudovibrio axinellae]